MDPTGLPGGPQVAPGPTPGLTAQEGSKGEHPGSAGRPGLQEKLAWKGWSPSLGCLGGRAGQTAQEGQQGADTHLHEGVAFGHEAPSGDLLELLTDVRDAGGFQDQGLMLLDEGQRHPEDDLGALVEQTIPDAKHGLQRKRQRVSAWPPSRPQSAPGALTSMGRTSTNRQMNQRDTTRVHSRP